MLPEPALLAIGILIALLVLLPARRLHLAGFSREVVAVYMLGVWALAMVLAIRPLLIRVLIPILVVLYLAPFVTAPGRPMKNVTPPDGPTGPGGTGGSAGTG